MPPGHDPVPGAGWWRQTTTAVVLAELIRQPQWPDVNCGMAAWWGRRPGDGVGSGHWPLAATGQCCFCHYPLTSLWLGCWTRVEGQRCTHTTHRLPLPPSWWWNGPTILVLLAAAAAAMLPTKVGVEACLLRANAPRQGLGG